MRLAQEPATSITRYTTPPIQLLVKDTDITSADVYVTLRQGDTVLTLSGNSLTVAASGDDTSVIFQLTQEQAGQFKKANAEVQVNWLSGGIRYATGIQKVAIFDNLLEEVIP